MDDNSRWNNRAGVCRIPVYSENAWICDWHFSFRAGCPPCILVESLPRMAGFRNRVLLGDCVVLVFDERGKWHYFIDKNNKYLNRDLSLNKTD